MNKQPVLQKNVLTPLLAKRALVGAGIALALIVFFLVTAGNENPAWPKFWMIRPLVIVPLAGAAGGLCYYLLNDLRPLNGFKNILAKFAAGIIYIVGLWLGTVLGLDGTYWN